jgi:hypothetical protein
LISTLAHIGTDLTIHIDYPSTMHQFNNKNHIIFRNVENFQKLFLPKIKKYVKNNNNGEYLEIFYLSK